MSGGEQAMPDENLKSMSHETDVGVRDNLYFSLERMGDAAFIEDTLTVENRDGTKKMFKRRFLLSLVEKTEI